MSAKPSPWRRAVEANGRRPPVVVKLPTNAFSDEWDMKPAEPVEVGVRIVAEGTLETARSWAVKKADRRHPGKTSADDVWIEAFNQALVQWVVARAMCKPDDATQSYWPCAEDIVPVALSSQGLMRLWEEHEMLAITAGALSPEVDLDACEALGKQLAEGSFWEGLSPNKARKIRRLLARALELAGYSIDETAPPQDGVRLTG